MTLREPSEPMPALPRALTDTRGWIWGAVALSIAIFTVLGLIHVHDEKVRTEALTTVRDFREARIDLTQGFLHIALAGGADLPFDRAQGLALLQQALSSLDRTIAGANVNDTDIAPLREAIVEVRAMLGAWVAPDALEPGVATRLRIAFHQLDRLADATDEKLRADLREMTEQHAALFRAVMGVAALLLIAMCGIILLVNGAHERSLAEQRRGEDELRHWAEAFTSAGHGIAITDARTYRILFANPAFASMRGMTVAEVDGCSFTDLYPPEEHEHIRRMIAVSDCEGHVSFESRCRRKDGSDFPVQVHLSSVRGADGNVRCRVSTPIDVTNLKRTQHELAEAQKMEAIGQLTGGVAHDFNNMLTVISGTIDILVDGVADRPQLVAIARLIDQAAQRGADLTRQLLAFARRQPLEPRETEVNGLIGEVARLLRPTLGAQVEIETALDAAVWPAMIDPSQLSNALINLAVNARDAMPGGGRLKLETANVELSESVVCGCGDCVAKPGPYVMIAVSDTGTGIPADIRDKVFQPFFTTKEAGKGTGLGLSMVYGFIKQSGGHIEIDTAEGRGTAIRLYLPRSTAPARKLEPVPVTHSPGGNETVLVVEDDDMVRKYVVAQMHSLGYRTLTAIDGASALAIIESGAPFDLLFTDVVMPGGMNGGELADEVLRRRPGTPVLYTSGYNENTTLPISPLAAGVDMLTKPYRKRDLAQKLREVLSRERTAPPADPQAAARP